MFFLLRLLSLVVVASFAADSALGNDCGQRPALTRGLVHFGNESQLGEWPWHVALFHRMNRASPSYACGGTIISENYIVTAAHCVYPRSRVRPLTAAEILVRAGIANIQQLEHSLQQFAVAEIVRHEEFNTDVLGNDIALLKIAGALEMTNYVRPICLWNGTDGEELIVGKGGTVAGWGLDENGTLPDVLKHAVMPIVSRKSCRDSDPTYYTNFLFDRKTFCAGYRNGTSAAPGDSGGGLYIEINEKWFLRGIVSNGKLQPTSNAFDARSFVVFTDIAHFMPWVNSNTGLASGGTLEVRASTVCGKVKNTTFTRSGFKEERKWPWRGEVYRNDKKPVRLCDTAIISERFALSPAEVFTENDAQNPSQRLLVVFQVIRNFQSRPFSYRKIKQMIRHEQFDRVTRRNNMALLEFDEALEFSELLRPICLWEGDLTEWETSKAVGYIGEFQEWKSHHEECITTYMVNETLLHEHSLCIPLSVYSFRGTLGDLMYVKINGSWYLGGVSYNMFRRDYVHYILMQDVTYYRDWIRNNIMILSRNLLGHKNCSELSINQWLYSVLYRYVLQCYGTLITTSLLLTTASCIDTFPVQFVSILNDRLEEPLVVKEIHRHPSYDKLEQTHNLAILLLDKPLNRTPICLPNTNDMENIKSLDFQSTHYSANPVLNLTVEFSASNVRSCAERWLREGAKVNTSGGHICGHMVGISGYQCTANLHGTPLVYATETDSSIFATGVLDIGKSNHCHGDDLPEAYLDVNFYLDWIAAVEKDCRGKVASRLNTTDDQPRTEWRTGTW
ncbi:uncharacterized protein LOC129732053 [Wyeomyia smithii]|uniref:uncharacterized protein LOC129732053 n=1 Tax=Wyeomyia smithii TaxID=174621 RepID=UPI002467F83E|nr:uncharacterized protein LOC129732053 [Wyeomyia smithii]